MSAMLFSILLWVQGLYFAVTALWPLVHMESFLAFTGPKTDHENTALGDHWLVATVSVLIAAVGLTLLVAAWRRTHVGEVLVLACAAAGALLGIDVVYVARGAILPIYLVDAAAEMILLAGWAVVAVTAARGRPQSRPISVPEAVRV